jgi:hypothetical protein
MAKAFELLLTLMQLLPILVLSFDFNRLRTQFASEPCHVQTDEPENVTQSS